MGCVGFLREAAIDRAKCYYTDNTYYNNYSSLNPVRCRLCYNEAATYIDIIVRDGRINQKFSEQKIEY